MSGAGESASTSIQNSLPTLVAASLEREWSRWPGMRESFSPRQLRQTAEDTSYHLQFVASALWFEEQALLDDYVIWCKVLFANLGMPAEWITGSLECISESLGDALPPIEEHLACAYIDRALEAFHKASTESSSFIAPGSPLGELARAYLQSALAGDRFAAVQMLVDAVEGGTSIREIYAQVFQPTQREIGRLWQLNQVSVAREHYVTAVTQVAMARLYEHIFAPPTSDRTLVVACVGGELHELGARMVADFFEMDRWNSHYLGANTPNTAIIEAVREANADVLALSATMSFHVGRVAEVIEMLRSDDAIKNTKVLVGGYPFNLAPELWQRVGADGYASSAEEASEVAEALL